MSERPNKKAALGTDLLIVSSDKAQELKPVEGEQAGTDLARFAQDVIALNRQLSSRSQTAEDRPICRVSSLETLRGGLSFKKKIEIESASVEAPVAIHRFRKES
ncbi:MAG: hypothetical protein NTX25_16655 [Proteobacteria bacterium]|nr:hypothetical protein [Pseudomonadota bacterium]